MTDSDTLDDAAPAPPPPLTKKAQSAFRAIAEWCDEQRADAEVTAKVQFRTIWWLLGAGLIVLLSLPRIVAYIDYFGIEESLPPVVVKEAKNAQKLLRTNQSEMQKEVDDAATELKALQKKIAERKKELAASVADLRAAIMAPLAVWKRTEIAGLEGSYDIRSLIRARDGTLIAAGQEGAGLKSKVLLLRSRDGVDWTPVRPEVAGERLAGTLFTLMIAPDGTLIAAGREGDGLKSKVLLLRLRDGVDWTPVRPEVAGERLAGNLFTLVIAKDGTLIAAGRNTGILKSVAKTERSGIANSLLDGGGLPSGLLLPAGTAQRQSEIVAHRTAIEVLRKQEKQQKEFLETAVKSRDRQEKAVGKLKTVTINLEKALRASELVRQASRIATRLAIVALLMFLVQVVVNRYRYLQRLAGFYQARAQAFHMLADSDPGLGARLLKDVTVTELITSLSPDAIRFDKTAEPPTQHIATLLQAALRKK